MGCSSSAPDANNNQPGKKKDNSPVLKQEPEVEDVSIRAVYKLRCYTRLYRDYYECNCYHGNFLAH